MADGEEAGAAPLPLADKGQDNTTETEERHPPVSNGPSTASRTRSYQGLTHPPGGPFMLADKGEDLTRTPAAESARNGTRPDFVTPGLVDS